MGRDMDFTGHRRKDALDSPLRDNPRTSLWETALDSKWNKVLKWQLILCGRSISNAFMIVDEAQNLTST